MKRREFITLFGGAAAAWPITGHAQQPDQMPRIGCLLAFSDRDLEGNANVAAFREELAKFGWIDGRSVRIEYRWTGGDPARAKDYAAELVALKSDVILANGTLSLVAARKQTGTIPIVFAVVGDPVGQGFVTSNRGVIISLAARYRLPAVYAFRYYAVDGGLLSYGHEFTDVFRRSASYVDRILRGGKPADMPVQQPTKYELVINLKTAKALGIEVPAQLLARADEVIE